MIILLGPDHSGKSTFAKSLQTYGYDIFHPTQHTEYEDYISFLTGIVPSSPSKFVCDRFRFCDLPYSRVVRNTEHRFTLKQFHNLLWLTLAYRPIIILFTRKGPNYLSREQLSTEEQFDPLLAYYRGALDKIGVEYSEYDWENPPFDISELAIKEEEESQKNLWWRNMLEGGYAGIGNSKNPSVVLLAEELSSNNKNLLPFEAGPSGFFLSEVVKDTGLPKLTDFFITNWKKTKKGGEDKKLFIQEIEELKPKSVVLLGRTAEAAIPTLELLEIPYKTIMHPAACSNYHSISKEEYKTRWEKIYE